MVRPGPRGQASHIDYSNCRDGCCRLGVLRARAEYRPPGRESDRVDLFLCRDLRKTGRTDQGGCSGGNAARRSRESRQPQRRDGSYGHAAHCWLVAGGTSARGRESTGRHCRCVCDAGLGRIDRASLNHCSARAEARYASQQVSASNAPARAPLQGPRTGGLRNSSLIAPSDGAHTPVISLDGHRPAATAEPAVICIVVIIVSVAALTVTRSADVDPNAARTNVHTLSEGRCRSRGSHCANQSKRDQRCLNPHELFLSVRVFKKTREEPRSFRVELVVAFTLCNALNTLVNAWLR